MEDLNYIAFMAGIITEAEYEATRKRKDDIDVKPRGTLDDLIGDEQYPEDQRAIADQYMNSNEDESTEDSDDMYQHGDTDEFGDYSYSDEDIMAPYERTALEDSGDYEVGFGDVEDDTLSETMPKDSTAGDWIKDFQKSDDPRFAGDSVEKRKERALAAYYSQNNEDVDMDSIDDDDDDFFAKYATKTRKKQTPVDYSDDYSYGSTHDDFDVSQYNTQRYVESEEQPLPNTAGDKITKVVMYINNSQDGDDEVVQPIVSALNKLGFDGANIEELEQFLHTLDDQSIDGLCGELGIEECDEDIELSNGYEKSPKVAYADAFPSGVGYNAASNMGIKQGDNPMYASIKVRESIYESLKNDLQKFKKSH